jgi:Domain of unknown function (DUF6265)
MFKMMLLTCAAGIAASGGVLPPAHAGQLESLSWLAGCWADPSAEPGSGEFWQPMAGNTLLGVGRTVKGGRTVSYEFLRLHEDPQGRAVYTALPSGQKETSFLAVEVGKGTASFENLQHDFPQRITYQRSDDTSLVVRIEGERQGTHRAVEFRFVRQACAR